MIDHLRKILDGPIVWAPGLMGAGVLSRRGGDFILDCGQDLAIGYRRHDEEAVHLYIEESFSFPGSHPRRRRGAHSISVLEWTTRQR